MKITKEYLQKHFWNEGRLINEIAKELKCDILIVFKALKSYWPTFRGKNETEQGTKYGRKNSR